MHVNASNLRGKYWLKGCVNLYLGLLKLLRPEHQKQLACLRVNGSLCMQSLFAHGNGEKKRESRLSNFSIFLKLNQECQTEPD
jgi:hypothetical protein